MSKLLEFYNMLITDWFVAVILRIFIVKEHCNDDVLSLQHISLWFVRNLILEFKVYCSLALDFSFQSQHVVS